MVQLGGRTWNNLENGSLMWNSNDSISFSFLTAGVVISGLTWWEYMGSIKGWGILMAL